MEPLLERCTRGFLQVCLYLAVLVPLPRLPLVSLALRLCWLAFLFGVIFVSFYWQMIGGNTSIGGLVGTALFVCNALANVCTVVEAFSKFGEYTKIRRLQRELDRLLEHHLRWRVDIEIRRAHIMSRIFVVLVILLVSDGVKTWINERQQVTPVFFHGLLIVEALRLRYLQVIVLIMELNARIELLKRSLGRLAELNRPRHRFASDVWQAYSPAEYDEVNAIRLIYGHMHELVGAINDCFGWSVLVIFLTSFFEFVCNAFWTFDALRGGESSAKYIFNTGTTFSLGTLVSVLFWNTDACWTNAGLWFFAFSPLRDCLRSVHVVYVGCWVVEIVLSIFYAIYYTHLGLLQRVNPIDSVVNWSLFVTQKFAHLAVLLEALGMRHERAAIISRFRRIESMLHEQMQLQQTVVGPDWNDWRLALKVFLIIGLQTILVVVMTYIEIQRSAFGSSLYWYSFLSSIALKFRILEILAFILRINARHIRAVRGHIDELGRRNLQRVFGVDWRHPDESVRWIQVHPSVGEGAGTDEDERRLTVLKRLYSEIYLVFGTLNDCFGWSLLTITALYFTYMVVNAYWLFLVLLTHTQDSYKFVESGVSLLVMLVMLSLLCWHCQMSYDESRYIGCLVFKLVKPLGNKRYNDLVTELSLQTLHQQYIITAKQFFPLNLNLLGSMAAAIVTYLVILIQFMLSETSSKEPSEFPTNLTTPIAPLVDP